MVSYPSQHPMRSEICDTAFFQFDTDTVESRSVAWEWWTRQSLLHLFDPSDWLLSDGTRLDTGEVHVEQGFTWSFPCFVRTMLYNPLFPEFTSMQQFSWAVLIGIFMGIYTACWKSIIGCCVNSVWQTLPKVLLNLGFFSDLDGPFPLWHFMWIVPALFGGVLSYLFASLPTPIPGQNDWIDNLHSLGVQDSKTFVLLFVLSTAGMVSGLSLGPELPLVLTAGMIGSSLALVCKQSILSARVLNLTAASAAIGGFFGFPMAGALFVLEVPHRMGLQYFEALTPATIASIVAVLTNRLVTGNDVTGYFEYPFLNQTLPSTIFHDAIVFGLFGATIGILYTKSVLLLKKWVHNLLKCEDNIALESSEVFTETSPLLSLTLSNDSEETLEIEHGVFSFLSRMGFTHEPTRAGVVGTIVGTMVGITCMFVPHVMFWGESQLQNLIDKGRTPLPVFGHVDDPSRDLVALGVCMVDVESKQSTTLGFSLKCSALIAVAKIFVTGLSLGTGIVGGHFWAPLFVGCACSHFLTDLTKAVSSSLGIELSLSCYPCVSLLCSMGSCHVVPFRAHMAIILILTLTIDAFDPEDEVGGAFKVAGDYSAVFPLLTVSVFVALQVSRQIVFYEKQRSRGDITALPEVLCEPGKEGRPLVVDYERSFNDSGENSFDYFSDTDRNGFDSEDHINDIEIEAQRSRNSSHLNPQHHTEVQGVQRLQNPSSSIRLPPRIIYSSETVKQVNGIADSLARTSADSFVQFDDLLKAPKESGHPRSGKRSHRRIQSDPIALQETLKAMNLYNNNAVGCNNDGTGPSSSSRIFPTLVSLKRVSSFGQIGQQQPSLLDQARKRAASFATSENSRRIQKDRCSSYSGPVADSSFDLDG